MVRYRVVGFSAIRQMRDVVKCYRGQVGDMAANWHRAVLLPVKVFNAHLPGSVRPRVRFSLLRFALGMILLFAVGNSDTQAEGYHVQNWRVEDGLPDGQITAITQTPDGYLWIGTAKGLACFDGVRFKVFKAGDTPGFTDSRISSLTTDAQGTLWVGMLDGNLAWRVGNDFAAVQPPVPLPLKPEQNHIPDTWLWDRRTAMIEEVEGTPRSNVQISSGRWAQLVTDGQGAVWWHVSGLGLMRFQAGQWKVFTVTNGLPPNAIHEMACDHEGRVWFEADGQLRRLTGVQTNLPGTTVPLEGQWCVMAPASRGGLWVARPGRSRLQEGERVWRFADGQWHDDLSLKPSSPPAASVVITCILEDRTGRIWCGTASGGVFISDSQGHWQRLHPQNQFSQGYISCLFEDHQGNIWVGTVGDGLYRVTLQPATMLNLPQPFEDAEINTICATRAGAVWIGTGGSGAFRYENGNFTSFGAAEGLTNQHVCALFEDSHTNLWAGTAGGLFRLEAGKFAGIGGPPEMSVWVKALFEDREGRLWIGTLGGLICLDRGKFTVHYLRPDRSYCDIRCLAESPNGDIWVGTIGQGLFRLPGGDVNQLSRVADFTATDVRALCCAPDGILWIGGWGSGLFRMQAGHFSVFTTEDGLPSDRIQSIIRGTDGQLWLSTDNGVIGISAHELLNYQRGQSPPLQCEHISLAEGLANGVCSGSGQPVSARTADGRLWFPDYEGIAVLDPQKVAVKLPASKVLVEAVIADGKPLKPGADGEWRASSGVRRFEFDFTAPYLASQPNMHFRHMLAAMDHDWVDAGVQRVAYYSQLPPGQYQFHVMVSGNDNQWHAADQVIRLQVVPRIWERRWLQVLAGSLFVAILGGGFGWSQRRKYRLRLERLQMQNAMENERRRIARDLHDEFGSSLTGIALQGEATTQHGTVRADAYSEIVAMTRRVRQLIGVLDEVVWATNPENDSLVNFVAYLCDYTENFLSSSAIHCRLEAPSSAELPGMALTAQTRHNLMLATKEALNNSIRHAQARTIQLRIRLTGDWLEVKIIDDGKGFDPATARVGGNGLLNFKTRMELIHGQVEIRSQTGHGTTVTLKIPLAGNHSFKNTK
jgi:ligand-binding sensor domain-containing protein/signal transduction histidine kinase